LEHRTGPVSAFIGSARSACRAAGRVVLVGSYRIVAASGIAAFAVSITGCYTYPAKHIVEVAPPAVVVAQISDAGRVALSEPLGSGVARIDGQVVGKADSGITLMVTEVRFMNGIANKWQGQELTLRPLDVTSVSQKTFSRQRTVTAMVIGALAAAALVGVGITGLFSGATGDGKVPEPPPEA
jgi:hypothetical protein